MASHVSLDISRAADIDLNALLDHFRITSQSYMISIDAQLRNRIAPLWPSFFPIVSLAHCLLEFMHQGKYFLLIRSSILPPLLQVLVVDPIKAHFASSGS